VPDAISYSRGRRSSSGATWKDTGHGNGLTSPGHALVAAFQPLLAESESELEQNAGGFFHTIKTSKLNRSVKEALEEVFMSWLGQRLPNRTKQEIEKMLVGELPELL